MTSLARLKTFAQAADRDMPSWPNSDDIAEGFPFLPDADRFVSACDPKTVLALIATADTYDARDLWEVEEISTLGSALEAVTHLTDFAARASEARDEAIRAASPENSIRAIATAAGLSPARVHQILHGR